MILLAGTLRRDQFDMVLGRSVFGMPLSGGRTVISVWQEQLALIGARSAPIICTESPANSGPRSEMSGCPLRVHTDATPARGAGGALRDAAQGFDADDLLLVCGAKQVANAHLGRWARAMAACDADLVLGSTADRSLVDVFAVRSGALAVVPGVGFCDFKEQAVPLIARRHRVELMTFDESPVRPVRQIADYLSIVRRSDDDGGGGVLIEAGAHVAAGARVRHSVVLAGGRVAAGAVVVDSVVGPGATIGAGQVVVRQAVGGRSGVVARL